MKPVNELGASIFRNFWNIQIRITYKVINLSFKLLKQRHLYFAVYVPSIVVSMEDGCERGFRPFEKLPV
jgi:hypothetical protein